MSFNERTQIILGSYGVDKLAASTVAVYGLGGVGATAAIALVRSGVGAVTVTDFDRVKESNLNRLIFGFRSTLNQSKTEAFASMAKEINPSVKITASNDFVHGNCAAFKVSQADFHIDAIDSLNSKVNLIVALLEKGANFISSMGTGGKIAPEMLEIADIWQTDVCSLAKFVRKRLRNRGEMRHFPVVFSKEKGVKPVYLKDENKSETCGRARKTQGSLPFVPQAAGLILASYAVRKILET